LNDEFGGIDGLTRWLGLRWESPDRVRLTIRPELINPAGLLAGPVAYAMVDYSMGSVLWQARRSGERIATIGISINYVQTAREGEIVCTSTLDRHDRGPAAPEEIAEAE
jgi:acyl-coenzyme A thioesterase PaaI-like protein